MKIHFNQQFPQGKRTAIETKALPNALAYMAAKYPQIDFAGSEVPIVFSNTRKGSNFYSEPKQVVNIGVRDTLHLYNKATIGLTTTPKGLMVGCAIQTTCALIHELTHFVQAIEKRLFSEVETTNNEIEWLKVNEPFWYSKLKATKEETKPLMIDARAAVKNLAEQVAAAERKEAIQAAAKADVFNLKESVFANLAGWATLK